MKNKAFMCIVIIMFCCISAFSQTSVASKLQLERMSKQANGIVELVRFIGYVNGGDNLYFEFKDMQGYKGIGYITRSANVINQCVINENTGELISVSRSEYANGSERYISVAEIYCNRVNEKFIGSDGKKGTLSACIDTKGNLTFEFITNDGDHVIDYIENAVGLY